MTEYTLNNMGDAQHRFIKTIVQHRKDNMDVPSRKYLCAYHEVNPSSGYNTVNSLIDRNLVYIDEEGGSPTGAGQVRLTYSGWFYAAVYIEEMRDYAINQMKALNGYQDGTDVTEWLRDAVGESEHAIMLYLIDER